MEAAPPKSFRQSLSLRLLACAGAAFALALLAAWMVLGILFERHLERQLQTELERQGIALIAALQLDANGAPALKRGLPDSRYTRPGSGLYWHIYGRSGELRSRSLWDANLPNASGQPEQQSWRRIISAGPYEREILLVSRTVKLGAQDTSFNIDVAADRSPITAGRRAFGFESAIFMAMLWAALSLAAWVQVRMGLLPLKKLRDHLAVMSHSPEGRLPQEAQLTEIRPLTAAINDLADHRQQDIHRARQRARDLAHALKTPITALRLQIEDLPPAEARSMAQSLSLLTGAVEAELARTGANQGRATCAITPLAGRLLSVIQRTPDGAALTFDNRLPANLTLPLSEEAAFETLGALLENAARHAKTSVRITAISTAEYIGFTIEDDGDGIAEEWRAAALGRGVRLDQRGSSHGLGLSISQDFITASGGELELASSDLGGLKVRATWPLSAASLSA
jgi:signal transduction histidine kinase